MDTDLRKVFADTLHSSVLDSDEMQAVAGKIEKNEPLPLLSDKLFSELLSCASFDQIEYVLKGKQDAEREVRRVIGASSLDPAFYNNPAIRAQKEQTRAIYFLGRLLSLGMPISEKQAEQLVSSAVEQMSKAEEQRKTYGEGNHALSGRMGAAATYTENAFRSALKSAAHFLNAEQLEKAFSALDVNDKLVLIENYVSQNGIADGKTLRVFHGFLSSVMQDLTSARDARVEAFKLRKLLESAKPKPRGTAFPQNGGEKPLKPHRRRRL